MLLTIRNFIDSWEDFERVCKCSRFFGPEVELRCSFYFWFTWMDADMCSDAICRIVFFLGR